MYNYDIYNKPEPYKFFLCRPDGTVLYELNGIDEDSANIEMKYNNQYELSFSYNRYIDSGVNQGNSSYESGGIAKDPAKIESNGYHDINVGMYILATSDKDAIMFRTKYPPITFDGNVEYKSVTAYSSECELELKDLVGFKINTGETDSLEYLVEYDAGETEELISDYKGIPNDYIVLYNTYPEQLQAILNKYTDNTTTTNQTVIKEIVGLCTRMPRLRRKITTAQDGAMSLTEYVEYTYDAAGQNVVSLYFFPGFNARIRQLITFYTKYRNQLSVLTLALEKCSANWSVGYVEPSLCNNKYQFSIDGENIYSFFTNKVAKVAKCLFEFDTINRVVNVRLAENIGKDSAVVIDKNTLLDSITISCDEDSIYTRYSVSGGDDLGIQYVNFGTSRIDDISWYLNARNEDGNRIYVTDAIANKYAQYVADRDAARNKYAELSVRYNSLLHEIKETQYRVPLDSLQNNWDTFTISELQEELKVYNNLYVTLLSLYKEDYGKVGCNADGSVKESYLKNTEYWFDYYAYKNTIVQIQEALNARWNGSSYNEIDDEKILAKINAWKTEWSLFGTIELQNKIESYKNQMDVLLDGGSVVIVYGQSTPKRWVDLNEEEKKEYGFFEANYQYDLYMKLYNERNACAAYLNTLNAKLDSMRSESESYQAARKHIAKLVTLEGYDREALYDAGCAIGGRTALRFTAAEIKVINLLYSDNNYSNQNIIVTSLDTPSSEVDRQFELLEDAKLQLSIDSQPQIMFDVEIDNIMAMPEFKDFDFNIGNYVTLQYYDDYYITVRLYRISFNPCNPSESPNITFTNYIKSNAERSDLSYILGNASGSGSGSGSGSSGGRLFGDIDATISNTMLAKLLNSEMFGTRVSNVILDTMQANSITAKYATFGGLANGTTLVDGRCIETGVIISNNYNGTISTNSFGKKTYGIDNTVGSILRIEDGAFSFGGKDGITFDGQKVHMGSNVVMSWESIGDQPDIPTLDGVLTTTNFNTVITKDWIKTLNLTVGGEIAMGPNANITWNNVMNRPEILDDISTEYLTTISRNSITSEVIKGWNLEVGNQVKMGSNARISWSNVDNKPDIPEGVSDSYITTITKNTVTTAYVNALNITAASVAAENLTGTTISGKEIYTDKGEIGGYTIGSNKLIAYGYNRTKKQNTGEIVALTRHLVDTVDGNDVSVNTYVFAIGYPNESGYNTCAFRVRYDGKMWAENAVISGTVTATEFKVTKDNYSCEFNGTEGLIIKSVNSNFIPVIRLHASSSSDTTISDGFINFSIIKNNVLNQAIVRSSSDGKSIETTCKDGNERTPIGSSGASNEAIAYMGAHSTSGNIEVYGQFKSSDGSYSKRYISTTSSDIRLKTNIKDCTLNALNVINQIKMKSFDWKESGINWSVGLIADELEVLDGRFVVGGGCDKDGAPDYKSVDSWYLMGYIIKSIQELSARNSALEKEIEFLKGVKG